MVKFNVVLFFSSLKRDTDMIQGENVQCFFNGCDIYY